MMNILVAGNGLMAVRVVDALMQRHQVTCLHPEDGQAWQLEQLDAEFVTGEITSPVSLADARVSSADVFIACSNNDEQNIVACMAARRLGAKKTICVLMRKGILSKHAEGTELARSLGIDQVVRPIDQLAEEMLAIILVPGALEVRRVADGRLSLFRYAIAPGSDASGKELSALKLPQNTRMVHLRRGEQFIVPRGNTKLQAGDKLIAMGFHDSLSRLGPILGAAKRPRREAAVVGGGRVGRAVTRGLIRAGWQVKVIDSDRDRCELIAEKTNALVLHGDGTDLEFLEQEQVGEVPVVVAVTSSDERNLLVSLVVKQLGNSRVITRADRYSNERLFEKVGVDVVRSAKGAAIRTIISDVDTHESEIHAELEHGDARVLEIEVSAQAKKLPMTQLNPPASAVVGAILRGNQVLIPGGKDVILAEDHLFVFCARADEDDTRQYFADPQAAELS
ncbi:MAG: Trk system potassium transporter TrkA [Polyangiaceae bacterium]|nr:Trk system potassium transporter TrkA [Polyangiaceae bacterium]